jgi:hypothetical protein
MGISLKHTHEIMEAIKNKNVDYAITYLKKVMNKTASIPFKKYPSKGHKAGIPVGYPFKASKYIIEILNELRSNAKNAGGEASKVTISGYNLGRGGYPRMRGGSVYHHGKRADLRILGAVEVKESKPEEVKVQEPKSIEGEKATVEQPTAAMASVQSTGETKTDVTKENN